MSRLQAQRIFGSSSGSRVIGHDGEIHEAVESTMDTALRLLARGVADGYVVLAEKQRAGRGRDGRWECRRGRGVLMSVIMRLGLRREERRLIGLAGAVAACEAVGDLGVPARLKWPNDIVVVSGEDPLEVRKLGGILVEPFSKGDAAPSHVLGIGLNVNQHRRELPKTSLRATSMRAERGGDAFDRNELCLRLLERLDGWYRKLRVGHSEAVLARWRTLSCLMNHRIRARVGSGIVEGAVIGLRASGELILETERGRAVLLSSEQTKLLVSKRAAGG